MSTGAVEDVLQRAKEDWQFRRQLQQQPDEALHGYDIDYAERQAIIAADTGKLVQMGVSPELADMADRFNPVQQEPTEG